LNRPKGQLRPRICSVAAIRVPIISGAWFFPNILTALRRKGCNGRLGPMLSGQGAMTEHWKAWLHQIRNERPLKNTYAETMDSLSGLDKLAVWITEHVGTMGFFIVVAIWTILWLSWNFLAPARLQFDPPMAFVFWLFISNMIQLFLMPLIMVGQNVQGKHAEARAEHDLDVNVKAEQEIEVVLHHLERQNDLLIAMLEKQGIKIEEAMQAADQRRQLAASAAKKS